MTKKNVHITPRPNGWAVKTENTSKAATVKPTQAKAIDAGRKLAIQNKSELVIHGKDGKIRDKDSYGKDTCPPKDKKH